MTAMPTMPEDERYADTQYNNDDDDNSHASDASDTFQGKSDCGFSDLVHETLMSAGAAVHSLVGEPHELIQGAMKETGDFVKDTAVALHDFSNADGSILKEETDNLVKMMTSKDELTPNSSKDEDDKQ